MLLLNRSTVPRGRGITKEMLAMLSDGTFIEKSENLLITGATGCGKSYLACAMGRNACLLGHRALYYSMNRFIEALAAARLDGTYLRWINVIAKTPLLIIDDFGLQPLNHDMRLTLLQILEDRFAKGATIVTSQLPVSKWYEYINEPTLADYLHFLIMRSNSTINIINQVFTQSDRADYFA
jgi:DNA replication protein DnaC